MTAGPTWWEPSTPWAHGRWSLVLRGDELADLRLDGRRVLRSVRAVVRDRDWATLPLVVDEVEATRPERLDVHVRADGAPLSGTVSVVAGRDAGRDVGGDAGRDVLTVTLDLLAHEDVWTNRTGLVVLHPPQLAGTPLRVDHPGGSGELSSFPLRVSPHQPALAIAGLAWTDGGVDVDVRLRGEVFEMEDQRNWTDASFKTYSRPLSLPFPYRLGAGEHVRQRVDVSAVTSSVPRSPAPRATRPAPGLGHVTLSPGGAFPGLALGASTAPGRAPAAAGALAREVADGVLVELDLSSPTWPSVLRRAATSGLPLDVRAVLGPSEALDELAGMIAGLDVHLVAAFDPASHVSTSSGTASLRTALTSAGLALPVLGGARSHFTQLNREQGSLPGALDGIVFSITPTFHSLASEQVVESVAVQRSVVEQALAIAAGRPVHVGPVTLRPRFNDVATSPAPAPAIDDARQGAPELAGWTLASIAALAVPGVARLTFFEEWGPRGVTDARGSERPAAQALRAAASLRGSTLLHGPSPDGLLWAVGGAGGSLTTVVVANLDRETRRCRVQTPRGPVQLEAPPGGFVVGRLGSGPHSP